MILPHITKTQKSILLLLYKFRFLTTYHIQKILGHSDPRTTQDLTKDLAEKEYIVSLYSRKKRSENNKPSVFYLKALARHILKREKECDLKSLELIYKEKRKTKKFREHCFSIADVFIYFLRIKKKTQEIKFYTRTTYAKYGYFPGYPDDLPDAYMAVMEGKETKRYFIYLFDEYTPAWVYQKKIRDYIEYSRNGSWEAKTNNSKLPRLYFVCPNEIKKGFVIHYGKAKLERSLEEISLWVTSLNSIKFGNDFSKDWIEVKPADPD